MFQKAIALAAISVLGSAVSLSASTVLNSGTRDWMTTAQAGRADLLIVGDSIVNNGVVGWSGGIAWNASESIGLAGTSLLAVSSIPNLSISNYAGGRLWIGAPSAAENAPAEFSHHSVGDAYLTLANFGFTGIGVTDALLDDRAAYDYHVWTAPLSANAQLEAFRNRQGTTPVMYADRDQTSAVQPVVSENGQLAHNEFSFNSTTGVQQYAAFGLASQSADALIYYQKLLRPDAHGITVTGLSYSGQTAQTFSQDILSGDHFGADGRAQYLQALVAGNSGKLNVALAFGVNDSVFRTATQFRNDLEQIINQYRTDWTNAGFDQGDLAFTLMSTYQFDPAMVNAARSAILAAYRVELESLATGSSQISFVDLYDASEPGATAVANGYLSDGIHPTPFGAHEYSELFLNALIPEPTTLSILAGLMLIGLKRNRRA